RVEEAARPHAVTDSLAHLGRLRQAGDGTSVVAETAVRLAEEPLGPDDQMGETQTATSRDAMLRKRDRLPVLAGPLGVHRELEADHGEPGFVPRRLAPSVQLGERGRPRRQVAVAYSDRPRADRPRENLDRGKTMTVCQGNGGVGRRVRAWVGM